MPDLKDFIVAVQEALAIVGNQYDIIYLRELFYSASAGAGKLSGPAASCGPESARGDSGRGPRMAGKPNS